ncbi:MAG TPA: peroxidase-related enzyme [Baekduia sp.]|nr:peroxidase-related enzyme [Baekduia sp.]
MTFIETVAEDGADEPVAELYAGDREALGHVANYTKAFSLRPEAYVAWRELNGAIKRPMDPRRYELVSVAAARRRGSSYCLLAHGSILARKHLDPEVVRALAADHAAAGLDDVDVAVMDLAERVAADPGSVSQADVDRLRALGLSDADVLDVVLAAAARCFFSGVLDALGVLPDAAFAALQPPELRDALTVGRPIAET